MRCGYQKLDIEPALLPAVETSYVEGTTATTQRHCSKRKERTFYNNFFLLNHTCFYLLLSESVFQPKDIDLENGDIDDDERELEAFKRFCLQSVPPERKDKVKVNLNIKDIVLKKKSSAIGCS